VRFKVEKKSNVVIIEPPDGPPQEYTVIVNEVVKVISIGEALDLYDFNHMIPGVLLVVPNPAMEAATLQIGFGNGSYGRERNRGKIYRDRIKFFREYEKLP
jgi:hypothetical protein